MRGEWDIAVLGSGPAGGEAARAASESGLRVLLVDEQARPGGQVWRAKDVQRPDLAATPETREGERHRRALEESQVRFLGTARMWHIDRQAERWNLHILVDGCSETLSTRCVVLATGAREYVQPFPGWTTPGVFGLAGATALMKSQQCPPGRRAVVSGGGPLAIFAAAEILRLGGEVAALVVPNARSDWLRRLPDLAGNLDLARRGAEMMLRLRRAGVPILWRHLVTRATGAPALESVQVSPCDGNWTPKGPGRQIEAETLCVGHGLVPNTDPAALAGVELTYDDTLGVWVAWTGPSGETALPGLYLCGDGALLRGAETARLKGRQAGLAAARVLNGEGLPESPRGMRRKDRFGAAMTSLASPRPGLLTLTDDQTVVCRCETLTRGRLDTAIDAGARSLGALKSATRCGMGPCGGRYCMTAAARLIANRTGQSPASIAPPTPRPPLFPLPAGALVAGFDYDDLPIPTPAPL